MLKRAAPPWSPSVSAVAATGGRSRRGLRGHPCRKPHRSCCGASSGGTRSCGHTVGEQGGGEGPSDWCNRGRCHMMHNRFRNHRSRRHTGSEKKGRQRHVCIRDGNRIRCDRKRRSEDTSQWNEGTCRIDTRIFVDRSVQEEAALQFVVAVEVRAVSRYRGVNRRSVQRTFHGCVFVANGVQTLACLATGENSIVICCSARGKRLHAQKTTDSLFASRGGVGSSH